MYCRVAITTRFEFNPEHDSPGLYREENMRMVQIWQVHDSVEPEMQQWGNVRV